MELLDVLTVYHGTEAREIELYQGDLTSLKPEEAVDILVVSAFPNDYTPTPTSLIGALYSKGVSVLQLADAKAVDLRQTCSCWLSQEIVSQASGIQFKRILCFEPCVRGTPPEVVGDIFRTLIPFLGSDTPSYKIAMPLVASGDQRESAKKMLASLLEAAVHWMALGIPLKKLKIVEHSVSKAAQLKQEFSYLKRKYEIYPLRERPGFKYEIFISYSHKDTEKVLLLTEELQKLRPNLSMFLDRQELNAGMAWQQEIYEALDDCRKVIAVYSPTYLISKVCQEEFNIAMFRHRESEEPILFPIFLFDAKLPTYMKVLLQYVDCREGDEEKLRYACREFFSKF
ncbi:toll/interleukin-1 receptor domain-containing protein [Coleofasciculus chthonoplastes]|uniref:toll/interleukin-1 receptor domain-containing protein n=1 Tax=Coleofasciculus chthonoplastes TaxID=64178 RepID=UPI003304C71D